MSGVRDPRGHEHRRRAREASAPVPGMALRSVKVEDVRRVEVSNARAAGIDFELRLRLPEGARIVRADHSVGGQKRQAHFPPPQGSGQ